MLIIGDVKKKAMKKYGQHSSIKGGKHGWVDGWKEGKKEGRKEEERKEEKGRTGGRKAKRKEGENTNILIVVFFWIMEIRVTFYFFLALLKYIRHIIVCKFNVYSMILYTYTL